MELTKKSLKYYEPSLCVRKEHAETADMIVPDSYPDIAEIKGCVGVATVRERNLQNGRLLVSGNIRASVYYAAENAEGLRELTLAFGFVHMEDADSTSESDEPWVCAELKNLSAAAVNSRKISLNADVMLDMAVFSPRSVEITSGIGAEPEEGIETLVKMQEVCVTSAVQNKSFTVVDTMEFAENSAVSMVSISGVSAEIDDCRLVAGKAVIKGVLHVSTVCMPPSGEPFMRVSTGSFSQIAELPGADADADVECSCCVRMCEAKNDEESDGRIWDIKAGLDVLLAAKERRTVPMVTDMYSTVFDTNIKTEEVALPASEGSGQQRKDISDALEGEQRAESIIALTACIGEPADDGEGGILAELSANAFCRSADGGYFTASGNIPVRFQKCANPVLTFSHVRGSVSGGGVELTGEARCGERGGGTASCLNIAEASIGGSRKRALGSGIACVMQRVSRGEPLWNIAKRNGSTAAAIAALNGIDGDTAARDGLLLIPSAGPRPGRRG